MTPQEKAKELVDKYFQKAENIEWTTDIEKKEKSQNYNNDLGTDVLIYWNELAKQCALIAVDECIKTAAYMPETLHFWNQVKQEIEKL